MISVFTVVYLLYSIFMTKGSPIMRGSGLDEGVHPLTEERSNDNPGPQPLPGAYEFDMMLTPQQFNAIQKDIYERKSGRNPYRKRKMVSDARYYWPNGIIPYQIDPSVDFVLARRLMTAIQNWQEKTCLRFIHMDTALSNFAHSKDYVVFKQHQYGCGATVGKIGGPQLVNLSSSCGVGTVEHELGHVIGFVHEQSRPDRDDHVQIVYQNIELGKEDQFEKYSNKEIRTFNLPYNVGSIMHYSPTAFSRSQRLHTIESKDAFVQTWMGQREELSFLDIKLANLAYKCNAKCYTNIVCENGGYIGPACTCICPSGLSGTTCNHVINTNTGCNRELTSPTGLLQSPNYPKNYNNDEECYWFIKGSKGSSIQLTFLDFETENTTSCDYDYLEIRQYGPDRYGQRYCGESHKGRTLLHHDNTLLLHFKSDSGFTYKGFQIFYQIFSLN